MGTSGTILHYDGSGWTPMVSGTTNGLFAVGGSSASDVFAVGSLGTILHYDGSSWTATSADLRELPMGYPCRALFGIWGAQSGEAFVVGANELILRHCPGGVCPTPPPP